MTKVQKLLYLVYGYYLSEEKDNVFKESPKAWPYGPVFPRVHKKLDLNNVKELEDPSFSELKQNNELLEVLERVIDKFSKYSATQLSDWSHQPDGPWDKTTKVQDFKWGVTQIPDGYIKDYFSKLSIF